MTDYHRRFIGTSEYKSHLGLAELEVLLSTARCSHVWLAPYCLCLFYRGHPQSSKYESSYSCPIVGITMIAEESLRSALVLSGGVRLEKKEHGICITNKDDDLPGAQRNHPLSSSYDTPRTQLGTP